MKRSAKRRQRAHRPPPRPCAEIQERLFDYMAHELGSGPSHLVREHLQKCPACRQAAAEMQTTLDLLKGAANLPPAVPTRLSDQHRKRLWRALMHPLLDWIYTHHMLVSLLITALAIVIGLVWMEKIPMPSWNPPEAGPSVIIGIGTPEEPPAPNTDLREPAEPRPPAEEAVP